MNNPLSKLSSRRSYAYLAVIVVSIMILSGLAGIIPVNVTQGNGSQNQKVQPAAGSDEILSFFETGLPTYGGSTQFPWSVNVVNTTLGVNTTASTSASILNFTLPLGTYNYKVGPLDNFTSSPAKGSVNLNKAFVSVTISFKATIYSLSFVESGLPYSVANGVSQAPLWDVTISNSTTGLSTTSYSSGQKVMFEVPNVNISYKIPEVNGYFATPASGYVLVSNGTYIINVQFSNAYAYLTFNEKGLFSNTSQNKADGSFGMHWSMSATNTGSGTTWTASSDSSQIKFWLPLGTYTYTASPVTGFSVSVGGTVTLSSSTFVNVTYTLTAVPTQTGIKNYYLNLYEVGLPAGTSWSLAITNSTSSNTSLAVTSTSALILVTKPNGTYYVRVLDSGTMSPNPAEYLLTVNGANASKTVVFSSALHWVNFTERNLPAGQKWGVIIEGINNSSIEYSTTYRDLAVQLPNGSYFYRVVTLANNVFSLTNSSGFIVVPGAKLFNVSFTSYQYLLTFTESALPAGTPWSVLINEPDGAVLQISTSQTSVSTYLPNGTYLYVPTTSVNYRASPSESTLHIGGQASSTFAITFISNLYKLSFVESGLPTGRFWNVAITDGSGNVQSYFSDTGYLNVSLLNGTYSYKIYNSSTYIPSPSSGTVIVSGTPAAENIQFTRYAWNLAFNETGLNGTVWNVTVTAPNGTIYSSSSNLSQIVFNLTNGTYTYTINSANKTWTTTTTYGSSTILGSTQYVNVNFSEVLYSVSFKVTGLPTNTTWGVTFNGENYSTNTTYINITLPNGTYSYVVKTINDYTVAPINGTIHLKGGNQTASITYSKKTTPPPPPVKSGSYSAYIVVGVLIGLGAVGLGIIFVLYYQRKKT